MTDRPTGALLIEDLTDVELERAARVDTVLPALREAAAEVDQRGAFHLPHVRLLAEAGLLGLVVPREHGGLGGSLRDLAAATFAMGTACPSTALAYFFHCSSASRGLLGLEAIEAGRFPAEDAEVVRAFSEKVLRLMGEQGRWLANFASESAKSSQAKVLITTEARPVDGGWLLKGVKAFGCATGVADTYLVTATLAGHTGADGLALFLVPRDAEGVSERTRWDALGMRGTATHGIVLDDVFVPAEDALALPGAFVTMMQMSRGSFVGNQLAATAVYLGAAQAVYDEALQRLSTTTFADTGRPVGFSPFHQQLIGEMTRNLADAYLWTRRQLLLETSEPPLLPKHDVLVRWRLAKGSVCEAAFAVGTAALKACGTSATGNGGVIARGLRDLSMGLVQAFPAERGRLEAAHMVLSTAEETQFATSGDAAG
jgi:alkylation response protein AidB-like acyl-CoA dehydrogenase